MGGERGPGSRVPGGAGRGARGRQESEGEGRNGHQTSAPSQASQYCHFQVRQPFFGMVSNFITLLFIVLLLFLS